MMLELDHQTGRVQETLFGSASDWGSLSPPSGRVRWALPRNFLLRFRGELEFQNGKRSWVEIDLPFRWKESFFDRGAHMSQRLIPKMGQFQVTPCDRLDELEHQLTQRILPIISGALKSAAARCPVEDGDVFWENLRQDVGRSMEHFQDLGFFGRKEDRPWIQFTQLQVFEKPEVYWKVFDRPADEDAALEGRESLTDISEEVFRNGNTLRPGQLLKLKLSFRSTTFFYLWHLGTQEEDKGELFAPQGGAPNVLFQRYEWTPLLGPRNCPWSTQALQYSFNREDRFRYFPETWIPDFQVMPIDESPGDNAFFLIASPEALSIDTFEFEKNHSPNWKDPEWLQTGNPPWSRLEKMVRDASKKTSPNCHVEMVVFKTLLD